MKFFVFEKEINTKRRRKKLKNTCGLAENPKEKTLLSEVGGCCCNKTLRKLLLQSNETENCLRKPVGCKGRAPTIHQMK